MALGALECRGKDIILRSTVSIVRGSFSLLFSQDHVHHDVSPNSSQNAALSTLEGASVPRSEKALLCVATHVRVGVGVGMKPGVSSVT